MNTFQLPRESSDNDGPLDISDLLGGAEEAGRFLDNHNGSEAAPEGQTEPAVSPPLQRGPSGLVLVRANELRAEPVQWLLPGKIPLGGITVLAGDPGLGKSLIAAKLAARVTMGDDGEPALVLILTGEDSVERTVGPRLQAATADLSKITFAGANRVGLTTPLVFPDDMVALDALVRKDGYRLVIIDPLSVYLGRGINSWKDNDVRAALAPLALMADRCQAAILIVVHLNKGQGDDPLQRLGGSIGIPAAARSVLLLARDPDDPDGENGAMRIMAQPRATRPEQPLPDREQNGPY
jgi:RecA-family ATPase